MDKKKPANGACASIHPHNSIVQWKPSGFTPHDSGFPLICDPNGLQTSTDIMSISSGFVNCLRHTHLHSLYNLHRIMLNPSSNSKKIIQGIKTIGHQLNEKLNFRGKIQYGSFHLVPTDYTDYN
jgi:hypothetical protein